MLLKKIAARDLELKRQNKAFDGTTLRDHNKEAKQIMRVLILTEQLSEKYKDFVDFEKLWEELNRRWRRHLRFILSSTKYRASRSVFLTGQASPKRTIKPENEDVATKVALYETLKQRLQTHETKKKGLSKRVLCRLAELCLQLLLLKARAPEIMFTGLQTHCPTLTNLDFLFLKIVNRVISVESQFRHILVMRHGKR